MSIVLVKNKIAPDDLKIASEDYGEYVKVVVDLEKEILAAGGEWHADGEAELLKLGSKQDNLWGGGVDLQTHKVEVIALINIRPRFNNDSQEILDPVRREIFIRIVKERFGYE